jgi:importin subunit beta-1
MNQQMEENAQLSLILENTINPVDEIRKGAEKEIDKLCCINFEHLLILLSEKLSIESEKKEIRQASAILIKNQIIKSNYLEQWFKISEEKKTKIKNNILSTLASESIDIRKSAALALAGICKVEIPKGNYINIFDILINTCQNNNLYIQLSSLTALEYIYEEIPKIILPSDKVANLLNTYYGLLTTDNSDPQLYLATLKSIDKFLPFINDFINDPDSKHKFYGLIEKYIMHSNEKIREAALMIFYDIASIYYDSLQDYIDKIFNFTQKIIENDIEGNKILSIRIWFIIGNEEDYRMNEINHILKQSHCFLQKYYLKLSEICEKYIVTDYYDFDNYSLSQACSELIYIMSRTCQYNFMTEMINYIGKSLNSPNENIKYSGLYVFKSLLSTIHKENFYPIVLESLAVISDILINNYPPHLKKLCSIIMKSITNEYAKQLINDNSYFDKLIELFLNIINTPSISSMEVTYDIILSINNLCKNIHWTEKDETNILSKNILKIYESIIKLASNINNYNTEINISCASFNLLGTIGERSALDVKVKMIDIFKYLSKLFEDSLIPENIPNDIIRKSYQEYISITLTGFLTTGKGEKQTASNLLQNILKSFTLRNELYDEAMTLIGSIALFTKDDFSKAMELISPYLIRGLRAIDTPSLCKASIYCFSDIINSLGLNNKYINDFLPLIINILSDAKVDQRLKPQCFNIISDLFLCCPDEGFKYFNNIMKIIGEAIQATQIKFDENSDRDTIKHFIDLREHLVEALTCIFSAVKEIRKENDFIPFVQAIVNYIQFIVKDFATSMTIMKDGLFLLIDFCVCYNEDILQILNIEIIKDLINKIENDKEQSTNEETIKSLDWSKSVINDLYGMK